MALKFQIEEINTKELEKLGISKQDIVSFPPRTFKAFMSGQRTSLLHLHQVDISGNKSQLDAKLSLVRNAEGKAEIRVHPVNAYAANVYNLEPQQIEALESGKKNRIKINHMAEGVEQKTFVYYDKETNEFIGINASKINPPEKINDVQLTEEQKNKLKEGEEIEINNEKISLDPTNELGLKCSSGRFNSIEWKHSRYGSDEIAFDIAMIMSGTGAVIMIGHLADLLLNTYNKTVEQNKRLGNTTEQIPDKDLRKALVETFPEMKDKLSKNEKITPVEFKRMIENHLNRPIEIENINSNALDLSQGASQNVKVVNKNLTEQKTESKINDTVDRDDLSREHKEDEKDEIKQEQPIKSKMKY